MIRIVLEIPESKNIQTEKQAVWAFRQFLESLKYPPLRIGFWNVKSFTKVHTAERIKRGLL